MILPSDKSKPYSQIFKSKCKNWRWTNKFYDKIGNRKSTFYNPQVADLIFKNIESREFFEKYADLYDTEVILIYN